MFACTVFNALIDTKSNIQIRYQSPWETLTSPEDLRDLSE